MQNVLKKILSVFLCSLIVLSCLNTAVFTGLETVFTQIAEAAAAGPVPGDINGDGAVNNKDLTRLMKYLAGEDVEVVTTCLDTNGDSNINNKDLTRLMKYLSGEDVEIHPIGCIHQLKSIAAVAATCTANGNIAYWQCTACNELFSDENGTQSITAEDTIVEKNTHEIEIIPGFPATMEKEGLTDGKKCSVCGTIILKQETIPISEFAIKYEIAGSDSYLTKLLSEGKIVNSNPVSYSTEKGCRLSNVIVDGYVFDGWYDAPGSSGELVKEIPVGRTGEIELYAKWSKETYKISFYSPLAPRDTISRTIDESVPIDDLNELTKYKFMGWTDVHGNIVTMVEPGTKDITLYANWISYRNQTISHDYMQKGPITIDDGENGQYLFVYDIGKIINVPLYTIKDFGNTTSGIIRVESETVTNSISTTHAKELTESIANSTTNSATWTLSSDWNELVTNTEDFSETQLEEENILISDGYAHTDGTEKNTGTVKDTGKLTKNNTTTKDLVTTEKGNSFEGGANVKIGTDKTPVSAEISAKYEQHKNTTDEEGTVKDKGTDKYNLTHTNDLNSTINSTTRSHDETTSSKIAQEASKQWGYSISKSTGGADSRSENSSNTQNKENTYSSSFAYTVAEEKTIVKEFSTSNAASGWHRLVCAGTIHVFAVVGYDIATHSYFYYTYSVLDDKTSEFYDYSATDGEYNDYETGVLPFEVPISIHEYISDRTCLSPGLEVDTETGIITDYDADNELASEYVNIPDYYSIDNGDGTYEVVKIVGIDAGVFNDKEKIKGVRLSNFITSIPDGLFNGCSSLEYLKCNNIVSIGENAFKDCVSLEYFEVNESVHHLGKNAFENVEQVVFYIETADVLKNAADCAAKSLTINLKADPTTFSNKTVFVSDKTDEFIINGFKGTYDNFEIISDSSYCTINGFNFVNNVGVPITLNSSKATLINVNVINASSLTMNLEAENTEIIVNGANTLSSTGDFAFLSKNISVQKNSSTKSSLNISGGKAYVYGAELTENDLKYFNSELGIKYITDEEYNNILNSRYVIFDPNGGSVENNRKLVIWNSRIGELPTPIRENYRFDGWYTSLEGGEKITADTVFAEDTDVIVYAHWTRIVFKVSFNANGGSVNTANKNVESGAIYGSLPTPTRTGWTFNGWFTETSGGSQITANTTVTLSGEQTLYAQWSRNVYRVNFNANGGSVSTTSKNVEYGSTYGTLPTPTRTGHSFKGWYTATSGGTQITASSTVSITAEQTLYARWEANSYQYIIRYRSTNGTDLGSTSATYKFGTTNTVTPPAKDGYNTPSAQSIKWDATAKEIVFKYSPSSVSNGASSGTMSTSPDVNYSFRAEYQNRTSNSVQVRIVWTTTMKAYNYCSYGQNLRIDSPVASANTQFVAYKTWSGAVNYDRSATGTTDWVTIPLNTTNKTSAWLQVYYFQTNSQGTNMTKYYGDYGGTYGITVNIPAY